MVMAAAGGEGSGHPAAAAAAAGSVKRAWVRYFGISKVICVKLPFINIDVPYLKLLM